MGLGETDPASEKGVGGKGLLASPAPVHCSICLEVVKDGGDRSTAKLQCGHQFHLDCIGSAFNAKGMMQCPNCRKIEKGNWLYANGCRSFPDISLDDWTHDEDLYELNYSEMDTSGRQRRKVLQVLPNTICWSICKERNKAVSSNKRAYIENIYIRPAAHIV